MRLRFIPFEAGGDNGASQYGLAKPDAAGGGSVEATEWMEGIALD